MLQRVGIPALTVVTVLSSTVLGLARPAAGDAISDAKAKAAAIEAQLTQAQNEMSALSQQYDAAQYHLAQINSNIATTKANIAADQQQVAQGQDHAVQGGRRQLHLRRHGGRAEPDLQRQRADRSAPPRVQPDRRGRHLARRRQPAHGGELAERAGGPAPGRADAGAGPGHRRAERRGAERAGHPAAEERAGPGAGSDRPARPAAAAGRGRRRRPGRRRQAPGRRGRRRRGRCAATPHLGWRQRDCQSASLAGLSQAAPPPTAAGGAGAVQAAESQIGVPYVWGGESPKGSASPGFDCSGLTAWSWGQVGVGLPHYSGAQMADSTPVPISDLQPGDLLFYGPGGSEHVAMYVGPGTMIEAPYTGASVWITGLRLGGGFVGRRPALGRPPHSARTARQRPGRPPRTRRPPVANLAPSRAMKPIPVALPHRAARGPHLRHRPRAHVLVRVHLLRAAAAQERLPHRLVRPRLPLDHPRRRRRRPGHARAVEPELLHPESRATSSPSGTAASRPSAACSPRCRPASSSPGAAAPNSRSAAPSTWPPPSSWPAGPWAACWAPS